MLDCQFFGEYLLIEGLDIHIDPVTVSVNIYLILFLLIILTKRVS
jgi:hypothetical protein